MAYDVVVIGAGFAGLSAAALLGKAGCKVAVLDQETMVGGRARVMERAGFRLEYGLHTFRHGERGAAAELMRELGRPLRFVPGRFPSYLARGKELLPFTGSPAALYPPEVSKQILEILRRLLQANPAEWYDQTFARFLGEAAGEESLQEFYRLLGLALMEPDPSRLSAGELISFLQLATQAEGQLGDLEGGSRQLFDHLTEAIASAGGELYLGTRVQKLVVADKRVEKLETSSGEVAAGAVIHAAPVQGLFGILDERHCKPRLIRQCKNLVPTAGIALDYGLRRPVSEIQGWLIDPKDRLLGRFPSNVDPSLAPPGKQLANWFLMLEPDECTDPAAVRSRIHYLRGRIRKLFPAFDTAVEWERILFLPMVDGAALRPEQSLPRRVDFSLPEIKNLFLIGDTTAGPGVSGDIAFSSAQKAVPRVLERLNQAGT